MTLRLPLLCKVGVKFFMVRQKRWWAINYKLMQQVYHMLSSSICVSVSSGLMSFIKKTIFKPADQNRSVLTPGSIQALQYFHLMFTIYKCNIPTQHKWEAQMFSPSQGACFKIFLTQEAVLQILVWMWITLFGLIPLNCLGWDGKRGT